MERGVIEGAEWINCLEDKKLGLHKTAKFYDTPGMHEPVTGGQLMFNKDVWRSSPPTCRKWSGWRRCTRRRCAIRCSTAKPRMPARNC